MNSVSTLRKQKGISSLTVIFILISLAGFGLVGIKVVPMYMDNATINSIITGLGDQPGLTKLNDDQLRFKIEKLFTINSIYNIDQKALVIKRDNGKLTVDFDYEVRANIYRNLDAVASFKNHFETKLPESP